MTAEAVILERVDLSSRNTLALPGLAEHFCTVTSVSQLQEALAHARSQRMAVTVFGGGSNLVLTGDVAGLVIDMAIPGRQLLGMENDLVRVRYGAGEHWHGLVNHALENGWYGLENLSLIPGRAGAAPIQNIGAYGVELDQVFLALEAVEIDTGVQLRLDREDCTFGYRDSIFKHGLRGRVVITGIELQLCSNARPNLEYPALRQWLLEANFDLDRVTPRQVSDAVCAIRRSKLPDPAAIPNAGSFFKNPVVSAEQADALQWHFPDLPRYPQPDGTVKLPAGWLIEKAGWKGRKKGKVGVHDRQSLVLVNLGGANGDELLSLAWDIERDIRERYAINLEIEPRVLGGGRRTS